MFNTNKTLEQKVKASMTSSLHSIEHSIIIISFFLLLSLFIVIFFVVVINIYFFVKYELWENFWIK